MSDWIQTLVSMRQSGKPAVLVSVASIKGSAPREAGAKMVVAGDAIYGTIGGGHLEFKAIEIARDMLAAGEARTLRRFPLGASLGQCCGGLVNLLFEVVDAQSNWVDALNECRDAGRDCVTVTAAGAGSRASRLIVTADNAIGSLGDAATDTQAIALARDMLDGTAEPALRMIGTAQGELLFFDPVRAPDFHIVLFGAGHVGKALINVLSALPGRITWVDEREDQFPAQVPDNVAIEATDAPEDEVDRAPAGSYFLVMTHSHALDQALTERILARHDFSYFGLIGSLSKRRQFEKRLQARGMDPARFRDMTCPIGVPGISGKEPAAIAVAVGAELLQVHEKRSQARANDQQAHRA